MNESWVPVFQNILMSSIWSKPDHIRLAWMTILLMKDHRDNIVLTNPHLLAAAARITVEQAEEALKTFLEPDPASLNPKYDGRRLELKSPGKYLVLNGDFYKKLMRGSVFRTKEKERKAAFRARKKQEKGFEPAF